MHTCKTYVYLQLKINKQTVCVIQVHWSRTSFASINIQLNQLQVRDVVWCRQAHFFLSNNCWLTIGVNTALRKLPTLPLHFTISKIAYSERKMIQPCEKKSVSEELGVDQNQRLILKITQSTTEKIENPSGEHKNTTMTIQHRTMNKICGGPHDAQICQTYLSDFLVSISI